MSTIAATTDLRFPIGTFDKSLPIAPTTIPALIDQIETLPTRLRQALQGLTDAQLDTPYRPGGWTVRQVVHHLPDSHLNSYTRFRLALTEDNPTIRPYDEQAWALLPDAAHAPAEVSLQLLAGLHARWVLLLRTLTPLQLSRTFLHPDSGLLRLDTCLALYAWHGEHHLAHITNLKERMGW